MKNLPLALAKCSPQGRPVAGRRSLAAKPDPKSGARRCGRTPLETGRWLAATLVGIGATLNIATGQVTFISGGTYANEQTWDSGTYVLQGSVTIAGPGASLSIGPGVTVAFDGNYSLSIGDGVSPGVLSAVGTSVSGITFEPYQGSGTAGQWKYIWFTPTAGAGSEMSHCMLVDGGSSIASLRVEGSSPSLSDVAVQNSLTAGIQIKDCGSSFSGVSVMGFGAGHDGIFLEAASGGASSSWTNVTIQGPGGDGLYSNGACGTFSGITIADVDRAFDVSGTCVEFAGTNTIQSAEGDLGSGAPDFWAEFFDSTAVLIGTSWNQNVIPGSLTRPSTWGAPPALMTITLESDLTIAGPTSPTLEIDSGVTVLLGASKSIIVGAGGLAGALDAEGVIFDKSGASNWRTIIFSDTSNDGASRMVNCTLRNGGADSGGGVALHASSSSPDLSNIQIESSQTGGLKLTNSNTLVSDLEIEGFGANEAGFRFAGQGAGGLIGTNTITGPGGSALALQGSPTISGVTISGGSGGAINTAIEGLSDDSAPRFSGIELQSGVTEIAKGAADLWAELMNSSPVIAQTSYIQRVEGLGPGGASHLTRSTTWGEHLSISSIELMGHLTIQGASSVLTIHEGATVKMAPAVTIFVGISSSLQGALHAVGNPGNRIKFESTTPNGHWGSIQFTNSSVDESSALAYCDLVGGARNGAPAIMCNSASPILHDLQILDGEGTGIRIVGAGVNLALDNVTIDGYEDGIDIQSSNGSVQVLNSNLKNITGDAVIGTGDAFNLLDASTISAVDRAVVLGSNTAAVVNACNILNWTTAGIDAAAGSYPVIVGTSFDNMTSVGDPVILPAPAVDSLCSAAVQNSFYGLGAGSMIGVRGGTGLNITQPAYWKDVAGIPFHVIGGDVRFVAPLTIEAGVEIQFDAGKGLEAWTATLPPLNVLGTSQDPVLLTTSEPNPTGPGVWNWKGVSAGPGSLIEHAHIEYGGTATTWGLKQTGAGTVRHCRVENSAGDGFVQVAHAAAIPALVEDSLFTANSESGIRADIGSEVQFVRVQSVANGGYGLEVGGSGALVGIRESSFIANATGGVDVNISSTVDGAYCWWDDFTGPGGQGPGSGQAISGTGVAFFNPWYTSDPSSTFSILDPVVSPLEFTPLGGTTALHAASEVLADWSFEVRDNVGTLVHTEVVADATVVDLSWDGGLGTLPDGTYDFDLLADEDASSGVSGLSGTFDLDSTLLRAVIETPLAQTYIEAGDPITFVGTADGSEFDSYVLEYGLGSNPTAFVTIYSSPTGGGSSVTSGSLNPTPFAFPASSQGVLTVRLRVDTDGTRGMQPATTTQTYKLFSIHSETALPDPFSPGNDDNFEDTTRITTGFTWSSDWTLDVLDGGLVSKIDWSGTGTQVSIDWNGEDRNQVDLADGPYTVRISATAEDDPTVDATSDLPVTIDNSTIPLAIEQPSDGDVLVNNTSVVLSTDASGPYEVILEYGPPWVLIEKGSSVATPFTWSTDTSANGSHTLRATLIRADGTMHQDQVQVTVANLRVLVQTPVFDPLGGGSTLIDITNDAGIPGTAPLDVSIYRADTSAGTYNDQNDILVWSDTVDFSTGTAQVVWNGSKTAGGIASKGEYVVGAQVPYAQGVTAVYDEAKIAAAIPANGLIAAVGFGASQGVSFDPYFRELMDLNFTLSSPAWVTFGFLSGPSGYNIIEYVFYPAVQNTYWWNGGTLAHVGLAFGDTGTGGVGLSTELVIAAHQPPKSLISLANTSLSVDNPLVDPIVIFPALGSIAEIEFYLTRDADIWVNVHDTVDVNNPALLKELVGSMLGPVRYFAGGPYKVAFDGTSDEGYLPDSSGTFTVEIIAEDAGDPTYRVEKQLPLRILR